MGVEAAESAIAVYWNNNKNNNNVYFLSFRDMSFCDNDSISFWDHSSLGMQYLYN